MRLAILWNFSRSSEVVLVGCSSDATDDAAVSHSGNPGQVRLLR